VEVEAVNGMCCKVEHYGKDGKNADIWKIVEECHVWQVSETKGEGLKCC